MKTLKNKLLIGAMATLGFYGNVNAQWGKEYKNPNVLWNEKVDSEKIQSNEDRYSQKIDNLDLENTGYFFNCTTLKNEKVPCENEDAYIKQHAIYYETLINLSTGRENVYSAEYLTYTDIENELNIYILKAIKLKTSKNEIDLALDEEITLNKNYGTLKYKVSCQGCPASDILETPYLKEKEVYERFGKEFVERVQKIFKIIKGDSESQEAKEFLKKEDKDWENLVNEYRGFPPKEVIPYLKN